MHTPIRLVSAPLKRCLIWAAAVSLTMLGGANAATLSDNLSAVTAGTEMVSSSTWIAGSFSTGSNSWSLTSATLLLANTAPGTAQLDVYSDSGQPFIMLSTLTSPLFFTSSPSPSTFTSTGFALAANSTYWLVLKAPAGEFDWAWTEDVTGTGVGFTHTWAVSEDGGGSWGVSNAQPMQFSVSATSTGAVPEPGSLLLCLLALAPLAYPLLRRLLEKRPYS